MAIRIIIVSDTHGNHDLIRDLPESDIFIHSGDFIILARNEPLDANVSGVTLCVV